jgi:D-alanyl-D-alanine carboxypeptidase
MGESTPSFDGARRDVPYPAPAMRRPPARRGVLALLLGVAVAGAPTTAGSTAPPRTGVRAATADVRAAPATATRAAAAGPRWARALDDLLRGRPVSVAVGVDGAWLYKRSAWVARPPASNEKLLLSMALLDRFPNSTRIRTELYSAGRRTGRKLRGALWIVGHGDPEVDTWTMKRLSRAVVAAGIRRIRGRVMGSTGGFHRDWWAPGWRDYFPEDYIALPTALTFAGNEDRRGRHVSDPERRAARSLTRHLERRGVRVTGRPGAGTPPRRRRHLATVSSPPFDELLRAMNRRSANFHAEVLGKWLGARLLGGSGSIAKGARAIERFAARHGAEVVAHDASGLSYANRVRADDLVELLTFADRRPWGPVLRKTLPFGGAGTLAGRLRDVRVRAKTGTLEEVSTLSGWVWLERAGTWAEFSILSRGLSKGAAVAIEDRVVRTVARRARP